MKLRIQSILQERQAQGGPDEYAIALVAFFVEHNAQCFAGCCRVKQTVGSQYTVAPLEVGPPLGYEGPTFKYDRFREIIERVYRAGVAGFPTAQAYVCNVVQVPGHAEDI